MKNTYKSFALLCMGLAAVACVEENFEPESSKIDTTPGNEIVFTASAGIEDGFKSDRKTKTVYGDKDVTNKMIEINWVSGDKISITSPQATGVDVGHYQVSANSQNNDEYEEAHSASKLTRLGDAGLQWTTEKRYDFYAVYPSVMNDAAASLTKKGVFTGVVPREQTFKGGALVQATDENKKSGYIATPNMEYAFMTAKSDYSRIKEDGTQNNDPINLQFNSLVTALQFDITAGTISNTVKDQVTGDFVKSYDIVSVSLISASKNISGTFEYDIANNDYKSTNTATTLSNRVIMHFEDDPVVLKSGGDFLDVTFFLLPEEIPAEDLQLQILFKFGSTQLSRTATIKHALSPGKKYIFNDVKLEDFTKDIEAGSWFDTIDPNTLLSQLSIPVASNVFATKENNFEEKSIQQVLDYESLWNLGVRGFELVNRRTVTKSWGRYSVDNDWSLSGAHFVCDEVAHEDDNVTFGKAFETLASKLKQNPKEFLVVFCTYQAVSDGYNPDGYVKQLLNYLDAFVASETNGFSKEDFIQITSSTKVADAQGKICVIIRPGDDDRYENQTNSSSEVNYGNADKRTSSIVLESSGKVDWSANVTLISDWGTAFDVWDRRYEGVARESTFETEYYHGTNRSPKLEQIENWLWGVSSSSTQYVNVSNYNNFNHGSTWPKKRDKFDYEHAVKRTGVSKAYIQEWARVSEGRFYAWTGITSTNSRNRHFWVDWPDSYTEKLEAIDGLFKMSVAELGLNSDNIYINSLSGYLISSDIKEGQYPFKFRFDGFTYNDWGTTKSDINDQGKGGDHPLLAYKLNKYVYSILSGEETMQDGSKLAPGPWGFVMMEHIGNKSKGEDDMSIKLVDLIMMNNFKLDLTTITPSGGQGGEGGGSTGSASVKDYDSVYLDGQNAISFE